MPLGDEPGLGELTLVGFLRDVTVRYRDREALVQRGGDGAMERWSYGDLWARSRDVAKALVVGGLGKGERVGILMTNRAEFLASLFGTAMAGGIAVPFSTFSTASELEHLIAASACSVLLFERQVLKKDFGAILCELDPAVASRKAGTFVSERFPFLQRMAAIGSGEAPGAIEGWEAFIASGEGVADAQVEARAAGVTPADAGVIFFSSGSTARPKGIVSAHRGVAIQLWRMGPQQRLGDGVRTWTANGFFWSGNFAMIVGGTLASGGSLVLQSTFQAAEALELMQAEKVSFLFAWPHQWEQLVAAPNWDSVDLSSLVYMDPATPIASHPTVTTSWLQPTYCYGNTETFTLSAGFPANTTSEEAGGSHGVPLPGNTIKIVDPLSGETMPLGQSGEIAVKGPTLMLGYLSTPLDETLDENGFFRTGDGGHLDAEGRLHWAGRLNDIIKTGGANVSPLEIDEAILADPAVRISQTIGVPHDTLGEIVVACVVPHEGGTLDEAGVRARVKEKLASFKVPRRVLFFTADELKLTGSAKIKTTDLRALAATRLGGD
jgi:fatty-acyl-CoA synthase